MNIGNISMTVRDNALGQGGAGSENYALLIGVSSTGEFDVLKTYTDATEFTGVYGTGQLPDCGAYYLDHPGVSGIKVIRVNHLRAGSVTKTAAGSTVGTMSASASLPKGDYSFKWVVTTGGSLGTAVGKYSLDGGTTYVTGVAMPSNGAVTIASAGIVLQFANGTGTPGFTTNDDFSFSVVTNATVSSVTKTAGDPETTANGALTTTGSEPLDAYKVTVLLVQGGLLGAASFMYTLDGVDWSGEIAVPSDGVYTIPNTGIVLNFADGSSPSGFVSGDVFSFTTTAPTYTLAALQNALAAWLATTEPAEFVHIIGSVTKATADSVDEVLNTAFAAHRYSFALGEARDQGSDETTVAAHQTAIKTEWAGHTSLRFMKVAGFVDIQLPYSNTRSRRSGAWAIGGRMASRPISEDPGQYITKGLHKVKALHMDARVNTALNNQGWTLLTTYDLETAIYCQAGQMSVPTTSDYRFTKERRVMNTACSTVYKAAKNYINTNALVDMKTGYIDPISANAIDQALTKELLRVLKPAEGTQHISGGSVRVRRDTPLLSDPTLRMTIRITPLGTFREIAVDIAYENPALV